MVNIVIAIVEAHINKIILDLIWQVRLGFPIAIVAIMEHILIVIVSVIKQFSELTQ